MKYIPAEKLIAEIEKRKYEVFPTDDGKIRVCATPNQIQSGWLNALKWVRDTIASLQQEQPEVDLDNHEIMEEIRKCGCYPNEFDVARHFYELGLNAKKEDTK